MGTVLASFFGNSNMGFSNAIKTYSSLTIGDGLTSQLPSLIISFATGLLVTGTKSDETIDQQLKKEFANSFHFLSPFLTSSLSRRNPEV